MNVVRANNGNAAGFKIGESGPNLTAANGSGEFVIQGATQVRFGNSAWDYNAWAGLRYDGSTNPIYIGGPASGAFASNASPPTPPLIFTGVSYSESEGSLRAPIFYDSNNTDYYVDPASTSKFARLILNNGDNLSWGGGYGAGIPTIASVVNDGIYFFPTGSTSGGTFQVRSTYSVATNQMRAPIYYDNNDTSYYCDPASTSVLSTVRIAGALLVGDGGSGHQYLEVLNANAAGGIKVGGLLCSDSYNFGNPSRNDILAKGNITAYSDGRYKTNIEVIPNAVEKVKQIRGVTYDMTDDSENRRYAGVIAQEVKEVLPEVVMGSEEDRYSVAYGNMVGLLIEAIKEQQTQIEALTSQINTLKEMIK
jgi:hypothetical protein